MLTFLFTDIEGSTGLWQQHPREMAKALAEHDAMLERLIAVHGGRMVKHTGDGVFAVFAGGDPAGCALAIQRAFQTHDWGILDEIRLRVALHCGDAESRGNDYYGPDVNLTARLLEAAWGGQILLSSQAVDALQLPARSVLADRGTHMLQSIPQPQPIFQLSHPDLRLQSFPGLRTQSSHPNNLPQETTPFVGRSKELAAVMEALASPQSRLLTIVGPGGMGKTRLAIKVGLESLEAFPHGVFFVPLAPRFSPDMVIPAIADEVGFQFYGGREPLRQLADYFCDKRLLLILDNFEHVLDASNVVADLLAATKMPRIMVTSRARLSITSETIYDLQGLVLEYDAKELFLQAAQRSKTDFVPSPSEEQAIVDICQQIAGNPLAIELAASWIRYLNPVEIAAEITRDIAFLNKGPVDMPSRHQSLQAVFDYSWQLLAGDERADYSKLAIFQGGFDRRAAMEVAGVGISRLADFLDKSLLKRLEGGRYQIHETLKQFAWEKLEENDSESRLIHKGYCGYYLTLLTPYLEKSKQVYDSGWLATLASESSNIDAAWSRAVAAGELDLIAKFNDAYQTFNFAINHISDLKKQYDSAIRLLASQETEEARKLICDIRLKLAVIQVYYADYTGAQAVFSEFLDLSEKTNDIPVIASCLFNLATIAMRQGRINDAEVLFTRVLEMARTDKKQERESQALSYLGMIAVDKGDLINGRRLLNEANEIITRLGMIKNKASNLNALSMIATLEGNNEEALRLMLESLAIKRGLGEKQPIAVSLHNLALIYCDMGDYGKARSLLLESLKTREEIGDKRGFAVNYSGLVQVALKVGEVDEAAVYAQKSLEISQEIKDLKGIIDSEICLGICFLKLGNLDKAKSMLKAGLQTARENSITSYIAQALYGFVYLLLELHEYSQALTLTYYLYHKQEPSIRSSQVFDPDLVAIIEKKLDAKQIKACHDCSESADIDELTESMIEL